MNLKRKPIRILLYITFILIIIFSTRYIVKSYMVNQESIQERELLNEIDVESGINDGLKSDINSKTKNLLSKENEKKRKERESKERMLKVQKLQEQNSDIVGWIEIEETNISYPVLQGDDDVFYLTHNYKMEQTEKGSIFLTADYDWNIAGNNLIIYGHNLVNGQMFKDLLKYSDEKFYRKHPVIRFTTNKTDMVFDVMSAFKSRVYNKDEENVFKYYDFINSENKNEYNKFVENAKKYSIYDTGVDAKYGEQLITLITCSYHSDDGRFVLIGKKKS